MPGVLHQVSKSPARLNEGINSRRNSGLWYQCRKQKWYESINEEKKRHQTYVKREKEIKHETTTSDSNSISNSLRIQMYSGQKKYDVYSIGNFAKDTNNTVHYLLSTLCCAVLGCSGVPNFSWPHGLQQPVFLVHHQLPVLAQTHIHQVSGAIQSSIPLSSPSPAFSLSQHKDLF